MRRHPAGHEFIHRQVMHMQHATCRSYGTSLSGHLVASLLRQQHSLLQENLCARARPGRGRMLCRRHSRCGRTGCTVGIGDEAGGLVCIAVAGGCRRGGRSGTRSRSSATASQRLSILLCRLLICSARAVSSSRIRWRICLLSWQTVAHSMTGFFNSAVWASPFSLLRVYGLRFKLNCTV